MSALALSGPETASMFLVLMRCSAFVAAAPILGNRHIPRPVRGGFAAILTVGMVGFAIPAATPLPFILAVPLELLIGLTFGFSISVAFAAFEMIGRLISLQTGLSLGSVFNPMTNEPATPFDPLFTLLASLIFLALNLHIALIGLLARSFALFPVGGVPSGTLIEIGLSSCYLALRLGIEIALPLALLLLVTDLVVALLARVIPQINVFMLGLPLKLLVGLVLITAALPTLITNAASLFATFFRNASGGAL